MKKGICFFFGGLCLLMLASTVRLSAWTGICGGEYASDCVNHGEIMDMGGKCVQFYDCGWGVHSVSCSCDPEMVE